MPSSTPIRQVLELLPEPERCWIRYAPKRWRHGPGGETVWLDLAAGVLGTPGDGRGGEAGPSEGGELADRPSGAWDDLVYLPPVEDREREARDRAAADIAAGGAPVLVHLLPGEAVPTAEGVVGVFDLLDRLLARDTGALARLPAGSAAIWPLVAGLTDDPALVAEGLAQLAAAGAGVVQALVPELPPGQRRVLAESYRAEAFGALFHGPRPDPRGFARQAAAHGLAPFLRRPLPRPPLQGAGEREAAGLLILAGELRLHAGDVGKSQEHVRAARFLDRSRLDLRELARQDNLKILPWLDPVSLEIVAEWAATGRSAIVERMIEVYAGLAPAAPQ